MTKIHFLMNLVLIQLVFEVKLLRIDVNHGPARRSLLLLLHCIAKQPLSQRIRQTASSMRL